MSEIICYNDGDHDGPAFDRRCPQCRRFLAFPSEMRWRENINGSCEFQPVRCPRCGEVKPDHIGWASDFSAP